MALYLLQQYTKLQFVATPEEADTVVDDIVDSGATLDKFGGKLRVVLFAKKNSRKHCGIVGKILNTENYAIMPWEPLNKE